MDYYLNYLQNIQWEQFPMYQIVLYVVFVAAFFVQLYYYLDVFRRATRRTEQPSYYLEQPPVSVVVCSTNEYDNLAKNLPLFLEQKYPRFDVIVINDCSTDRTEELLSALKTKYKNLYYSNVEANERFKHDRKLAITLGIKASQYDNVLFVAPDCAPGSSKWLAAMQAGFDEGTEFVMGHCNYVNMSGGQRCDAIYTEMFAVNAVRKGFPFYANYKNLGISKSMFLAKNGFANINRFPNSEETLFLCRNATAVNMVVNFATDSILKSGQRLSLGQWWRQRALQSSLFAMGKRGQMLRHFEMAARTLFYLSEYAMLWLAAAEYAPVLLVALLALPLSVVRICLQASIFGRIKKCWRENNIAFKLFLYDRWSPVLALLVALSRPNLYKISKLK